MRRRAAVLLAVLTLLVGVLAGTFASAATPNATACRALIKTSDGVTGYEGLVYDECRFDKLDAAVKALGATSPTPSPSPSATPTATPKPSASPSPSATPTTTPSPTPSPTSTPPAGGTIVLGRSFPNAATTGVPDAVRSSLTTYTGPCTYSDPKAAPITIDRKIITCDQFRILQPNVTITNSVINGTIYSDCCYLNGSFSVTDSEIKGPNSAATVVGEARFKLLRVEVTGGSRSVNCNSQCEVRDSYIHGQYTDLRGIDHESGIRQDQDGTIVGNTITCDAKPVEPDAGCSAAISGYGDFGTVQNNTITGNLIDGGPDGSMSYCIYGGSTQGKPFPDANHIVVKDNIFKRGPSRKCGIYGPVTSFDSAAPGNVWSGNVWDDGSGNVPPAN